MPILIDGNNLLHAAQAIGEPDEVLARSALCRRLGDWTRRTRQPVRIVFDGTPPAPSLARQIADPDVDVIFSGPHSADERIKQLLTEDSAARRLIVVSTDHEVSAAARQRRARPMRSDEFWRRVLKDLSRPQRAALEPPEKRAGEGRAQTDEWLREWGLEIRETDEF
ncbi:MAG: NYN domain-containing protein [Phycisphaerae bacterium]